MRCSGCHGCWHNVPQAVRGWWRRGHGAEKAACNPPARPPACPEKRLRGLPPAPFAHLASEPLPLPLSPYPRRPCPQLPDPPLAAGSSQQLPSRPSPQLRGAQAGRAGPGPGPGSGLGGPAAGPAPGPSSIGQRLTSPSTVFQGSPSGPPGPRWAFRVLGFRFFSGFCLLLPLRSAPLQGAEVARVGSAAGVHNVCVCVFFLLQC